MDAFEQLVAEIFFSQGYWVQTSVKVHLTKEEKQRIGRHSSPRWELDVVAYRPATKELLAIECKSFLDSTGVQHAELQDGHASTRYKLFREPVLREVVLDRLLVQMSDAGLCQSDSRVSLAMVAGRIKRGDEDKLRAHFASRGWAFYGPDWLRERLKDIARDGYSNQVSAVVAKLLLRPFETAPTLEPIGRGAPRNGRGRYNRDTPLRLIAKTNPKKPGSQAHNRFEAYFLPSVTTVGAAFDAGLRSEDIRYDSARGFIRLGDQ